MHRDAIADMQKEMEPIFATLGEEGGRGGGGLVVYGGVRYYE